MSWGAKLFLLGLAVPAIILIWDLASGRRRSTARRLAKAQFATASFAGISQASQRASRPIALFFCLGLALICVSMARPRWGTQLRVTFERSREVIIAIDLSKSMLAEDLKPNRLERAKLVVNSMIDNLQGESVGLLVFAGTAFLQSPMSPDYQILRGFLRDINPSFIPQGGTNYTAMLETALDSFEQSDGMADRFLIVISDGESLDNNWKPAAEKLMDQNVRAICLGFGTEDGSFIPDGTGGYHKDPKGAVVLSRLESATLRELASITKGVYREANVWIDLSKLIEDTIKKGRAELVEREKEEAVIERYQFFLVPALLCFAISLYREFPTLPHPRVIKQA